MIRTSVALSGRLRRRLRRPRTAAIAASPAAEKNAAFSHGSESRSDGPSALATPSVASLGTWRSPTPPRSAALEGRAARSHTRSDPRAGAMVAVVRLVDARRAAAAPETAARLGSDSSATRRGAGRLAGARTTRSTARGPADEPAPEPPGPTIAGTACSRRAPPTAGGSGRTLLEALPDLSSRPPVAAAATEGAAGAEGSATAGAGGGAGCGGAAADGDGAGDAGAEAGADAGGAGAAGAGAAAGAGEAAAAGAAAGTSGGEGGAAGAGAGTGGAGAAGAGAGGAGGGAGAGEGAGGAGVAGAGKGARGGSNVSGSTYPCSSSVRRTPRWTCGARVTASSLGPTVPTGSPSPTSAPRVTCTDSSWSSVTE
jgi:hypothetical protein